MSNPTTVTLVLNNLGGKAGAIDGTINASVSAKNNQTGSTIARRLLRSVVPPACFQESFQVQWVVLP